MYCRRCYAPLTPADEPSCPRCRREFDPEDASTFLHRPFPTRSKVLLQIIGTTVVGVAAAFLVALHQMTRNSGH
jgi:hypothetical protein